MQAFGAVNKKGADLLTDHKYKTIDLEVEPPIATIRLNRPERLNALNKELMSEVLVALEFLERDESVRAIVLCGAGRAFSSGFDIAEEDEETTESVAEWREHLTPAYHFGQRLWDHPKPIIAAVHGYCIGGACGLSMLCDLTISSEECKFGEPEIRFGSGSANFVMPWVVPMKVARELLYTGKLISARRAYEVGLVNEVVPRDQLEQRARHNALLLSRVSPLALRTMKEGINRSYEMMGMRNSLVHSFNLVAALAASDTEEKRQFEKVRLAEGTKAALAWRDAQFAEVDQLA